MATREELLAEKALLEERRELLARKKELSAQAPPPPPTAEAGEQEEFLTPGVGFAAGVRREAEEFPGIPATIIPSGAPSLSQIAGRIPETFVPSAKAVFTGLKEAVTSPLQTGKTILDVIKGGALAALPGQQGGRRELDPLIARATGQRPVTEGETEAEVRARGFDPLVDLLKGRIARPGFTLAEDPFGALIDISALATGGAATVAKLAPTASKAVQVANAVKKAADATNPLVLPFKAIKGGIDLGGKTLGVALELTTGTTGSITKALKGTPEFRAALRGDLEGADIVSMAKRSLEQVKDQRAIQYKQALNQIDQRIIIDIKPVRAKMEEVLKKFNINRNADGTLNLKRFPESAAESNKLKKVIKIIDEWGDDVGDLSPSGMDDLKQIIDSYFTPSARAQSIKSTLRNEVFDAIAKEVPEYKNMTAAYSKASKEIAELDKVLALGSKKTPEAALKRLMSIAKKDEPFRVALVELMEKRTGVNIQDAVAGLSLSSFKPQGFIGTSTAAATGFGLLAGAIDPQLLGLLAASSPRIVGEFLTLLSLPVRGLKKIDPKGRLGQAGRAAASGAATQSVFQAERLRENINRDRTPIDDPTIGQPSASLLINKLRDTRIA